MWSSPRFLSGTGENVVSVWATSDHVSRQPLEEEGIEDSPDESDEAFDG